MFSSATLNGICLSAQLPGDSSAVSFKLSWHEPFLGSPFAKILLTPGGAM